MVGGGESKSKRPASNISAADAFCGATRFAEYEFQPGGRLSRSTKARTLGSNQVGNSSVALLTETVQLAGPHETDGGADMRAPGVAQTAPVTADTLGGESGAIDLVERIAAPGEPYSRSFNSNASDINPTPDSMHVGWR